MYPKAPVPDHTNTVLIVKMCLFQLAFGRKSQLSHINPHSEKVCDFVCDLKATRIIFVFTKGAFISHLERERYLLGSWSVSSQSLKVEREYGLQEAEG